MFRSPAILLPHESTVAHDDRTALSVSPAPIPSSSGVSPVKAAAPLTTPVKARLAKRADSQVPNLFANPPQAENQTHELDDEVDEELSSSSN